ncbi:MAG: O-antigen ligase domain-containing protein [Alphaproteobacteria bacterium]|nr:MAG: O-antigen ligase domain-containing protein [Alphaproteobacteria bacterium]
MNSPPGCKATSRHHNRFALAGKNFARPQFRRMDEAAKAPVTWTDAGAIALERAPRYIICFLIFYAPFCYGLRNGAGEGTFVTMGFTAFFLFCWKAFLDGRWPRVPAWLLFCMTLIAAQGLWMTLNADSYYRWHRELITIRILETAPFPNLPGARDRIAAPIQFYPQLAVFCLMLIVINMKPHFRRQLIIVMSICVVLFAGTGIVMKLAGPALLQFFWAFENETFYKSVFASYRYHGNAATFLAMGLALTLSLLLRGRREENHLLTISGSTGSVLVGIAVFLNTSRAGWILALIVVALYAPALLSGFLTLDRSDGTRASRIATLVIAVVAALCAIAALFTSDMSFRLGRLQSLSQSVANRFPLAIFLEMIPDTPMLGFGPGAFPMVFPKYQLANPGIYPANLHLNEAHQDYFQLFFDWGYIGFVCWMAIFLVPPGALLFTSRRRLSAEHHACFVAVFVVLIHATLDFPLQVTSLLFFFGMYLAIPICSPDPKTRAP